MALEDSALEERDDLPSAEYWKAEIKLAEKNQREWEKCARNIEKRFRNEEGFAKGSKRFNILWANVTLGKGLLLVEKPIPDVRRRYEDFDEAANIASQVLEKGLEFIIDDSIGEHTFQSEMWAARNDFLLTDRGVVRVKYESTIVRRVPEPVTSVDPDTGEEIQVGWQLDGQPVEPDFDEEGPFVEEKADERVFPEHVYWGDYLEDPAKCWRDVGWVAFRHELTREDLEDQFGEKGGKVPLNKVVSGVDDKEGDEIPDVFKRAEIYEVWDRRKRQRVWISKGMDSVIETEDDPLNIDGFFPLPAPLQANNGTDSRIPVPDFEQYRDQAEELEVVTTRISKLTKALKAVGAYDAGSDSAKTIAMLEAQDGELIPLETSQMTEGGGLRNKIFYLPVQEVAAVLERLSSRQNELKQEIFELTGIADIMRGATKASETLGAQRIKAAFGSARMRPKAEAAAAWERDLLRIMVEIMGEMFSPETLKRMTGVRIPPEVMQILRDDKARGFRIDVETNQTSQPDDDLEKQQTVEMVTALTQYLQASSEVAAGAPQMIPLLMAMLKSVVRKFKMGREIEKIVEQTVQQLTQAAQQPQQQEPDPSDVIGLEQEKIKQQTEQMKGQAQLQKAQMDLAGEALDVAAAQGDK